MGFIIIDPFLTLGYVMLCKLGYKSVPFSLMKWWLFQRYKVHYQSYSFNQPPFHFTFGLFLLARYRSLFLTATEEY